MSQTKDSNRWKSYRYLSVVVILIGLILGVSLSIYGLRANNLKMIELRQTVIKTDEDNGDIETALNNLRQFVYAHMNTNLRAGSNSNEPPIQLVNQFNRAVAAEQARVAALGGANKVYVDAQNTCEISSISLMARAQCIQQYVSEHGNGIPQLNLPPKELYTFDFASPTWSPDLAGWAIIASVLFGILLVIRLILGRYINKSQRK
jgi:hypothetical protein